MPSFGKWLDVAITVALVGAFFTGLTIFEYQSKEEEVKDEKESDDEEKKRNKSYQDSKSKTTIYVTSTSIYYHQYNETMIELE